MMQIGNCSNLVSGWQTMSTLCAPADGYVAGAVGPYPSDRTLRGKILFEGWRGLKMTTATLFWVLVAFLLPAPSAFAQNSGVMGVNFTFLTSYEGGALTLAPSDVAGVVAVSNWNNYIANTSWPPTQGTDDLQDSTGTNTGAGLSMSGVDNGWYDTRST